MGQSNSPSENYLFLNVMVNFVIVNQKLTGSALHIEKNQTISLMKDPPINSDINTTSLYKQVKITRPIERTKICQGNSTIFHGVTSNQTGCNRRYKFINGGKYHP